MVYTLAPLPYPYNALEPYIDTKTMELHHDKHQQAYIDGLNKALENHPEIQNTPLVELIRHLDKVPQDIRTDVQNNGGGELNHSMFWLMLKVNNDTEPKGVIAQEIKKKFGSFAAFQMEFEQSAKKRFGSGWAWLCVDKKGDLMITSTANQDNPLSQGHMPILGLDVWEHAYYLKYNNRRPDYIKAWWHVVNWDEVEQNYKKI